ncbi:Uncharacterised protein [Mycobacteroides abscessus subsp. abscessus]|nr:Uncharacterised protein [Mycobacteroides abscessus subsp. abscessus]
MDARAVGEWGGHGVVEVAGQFELSLEGEQIPLFGHPCEHLAVARRGDRLGATDQDASDGDLERLDALTHRRRCDVQLLGRGVERACVEYR